MPATLRLPPRLLTAPNVSARDDATTLRRASVATASRAHSAMYTAPAALTTNSMELEGAPPKSTKSSVRRRGCKIVAAFALILVIASGAFAIAIAATPKEQIPDRPLRPPALPPRPLPPSPVLARCYLKCFQRLSHPVKVAPPLRHVSPCGQPFGLLPNPLD